MSVNVRLYIVCAVVLTFTSVKVKAMIERGKFVPPSEPCQPDAKVCEFWLYATELLTMVHGKSMTQPSSGKIYHASVTNFSQADPLDFSDVITADGYTDSRLVYVLNGTLPGPEIRVYEGQIVIVHVYNHLTSAAISMHFHGIHMKGTPWSDGVGYVTQCPILPGQVFTHKFLIAQPGGGTYWYHAHVGSQRTMGLYGAFIIQKRERSEIGEHVLVLQDWNHDWSSDLSYYKMVYGMYEGMTKLKSTDAPDGSHFSLFRFHSGLINGRGRYYNPHTPGLHNEAPLATFTVTPGRKYRLRIIGAGNMYPFRLSIDNHVLYVVASDGYDVEPVPVESVIITPGERYDVIIDADQPLKNYWIRAKTLEVGVNHVAEAILNYEGVEKDREPRTSKRACTQENPCKAVNCPFGYFPQEDHIECITVEKLRGRHGPAPRADGRQLKEFFLNFAFPGENWTPGSVNGRAFKHPPVSALTQMDELTWQCDPEQCGEEKVCACSYTVDIDHDDTVQMVFLNMGNGKGWSHPIHLHGHSFYVVKMGLAQYNRTTGKIVGDNLDIDCGGDPNRDKSYCNAARWTDRSWEGDSIPGLNLRNPPLKDTVMVPSGSYVVVRFKADNPGVWIMHCHIEIHNLDGMSMLVREAKDRIPKPPEGFPRCNDFLYKEDIAYIGKPARKGGKHRKKFNHPAHQYGH